MHVTVILGSGYINIKVTNFILLYAFLFLPLEKHRSAEEVAKRVKCLPSVH